MDRRPREHVLFAAGIVLAIAIFAIHVAQYGRYIADDAGITFAYAKNLARGHGLVLNPGTDPVEGYSNFAWLLVVLPLCARGTDPTLAIKVLSFVVSSATFLALGYVGRQLTNESRVGTHRWLAALAPVGLAAFAPYAVWASAGLENGFYCALFVTAILLYLRESFIGCAITLLVLSLTRVEGIGVAGLFAAHRAGVLFVARRKPSRREIAAVAVFFVLYGGYGMWHWWYFRALVPNSYLAKSAAVRTRTMESAMLAIGDGWTYAYIQLIRPYRFVAGLPFALVGLLALRARLLALTMLLLAGVFSVVLLTGGDFYPEFRLGTLMLPLWFLVVVEGVRVVLSRVRSAAAVGAIGLIPILVMCQPSVAVALNWGPGEISMGGLKPITADRFTALAANIRSRPIMVLELDIGNVAYFTDFAILDIGGLANLEIARNGFAAPEQLQHYVFEEMKPDIIHLRGTFGYIPVALIERDYWSVEGRPTKRYASGWWVRRDVETSSASFPSAASGAADVYAAVKRQCEDGAAMCHADATLSNQALARADSLRGTGQFAFAFEWYAAAWEADRRSIVALRGREDMRMPGLQGCANAPAAPAHLRSSISGSTVTLEWDAVPGASAGYVVEAGTRPGTTTITLASEGTTLTVADVAKQTYHVRVRSRSTCGFGYASSEIVVAVG
jgi:hypothetical protein